MTDTTGSTPPELAFAFGGGGVLLLFFLMILLRARGPKGWMSTVAKFRNRHRTGDWSQLVAFEKVDMFGLPVLAVILLGCAAIIVASWL